MSFERHTYQKFEVAYTHQGERVHILKADTWLDGVPLYHAKSEVDAIMRRYTEPMLRSHTGSFVYPAGEVTK